MKKTVQKVITLILVILITIFSPLIVVLVARGGSIGYSLDKFQPVQVTGVSFDVRSYAGQLLSSVTGTSGIGHYTDPSHVYPSVDIFYSQPYLTDPWGAAVGNATEALAPVARLVIDGNAYFMHEVYYSVDFGARTYTNFKPVVDTTSYIDPMVGLTIAHSGGTMTLAIGQPAAQPMPRGCLAAIVDTGVAPWTCSWTSGARITSSLEQIDYAIGGSPVRPGHAYGDAIGRLQTSWGNSQVIVQPKIDLSALSNYITLSYTTTGILPNGTPATITTTQSSASVGFAEAYRTDNSNLKGVIPSAFTTNNVNMPADQPTGAATNPVDRDQTATTSRTTVTGAVTYLGDAPDVTVTGIAEPHGIWTSILSSIPTINLTSDVINSFSLPQSMSTRAEFSLQPFTTLDIARQSVSWCLFEFDGGWPDNYESPRPGSGTILVPYGITVQNVYAMSRLTFKLVLISENSVQILTSTGRPVDPKLLTDFELSSIMMDPTGDNYQVEVERTGWDAIAAWFQSLLAGPFGTVLTIAIVVLVIVAVIIIAIKAPRRK